MLCNYCGKSIEGKGVVCPECAEQYGKKTTEPTASTNPEPSTQPGGVNDNTARPDTFLPIPGNPRRGLRFHRYVASMVDTVILGLPMAVIFNLLNSYLIKPLLTPDPLSGGISMTLLLITPVMGTILAYALASLILPPIYFILMESGPWQATAGKLLLGVYVVNADGARCSPWEAGMRYLIRALLPFSAILLTVILVAITTAIFKSGPAFIPPVIALIGGLLYLFIGWQIYISYLYSPTRQGLHDRLSNCYVVTRDRHPTHGVAALQLLGAIVGSIIVGALAPRGPKHTFTSNQSDQSRYKVTLKGKNNPAQTGPEAAPPTDYHPLSQAAQDNDQRDYPTYLPTTAPLTPEPPQEVPTLAPTSPPSAIDAQTVTFGRADRELTNSVALMNSTRTELRLYLGQREFTPAEIATLQDNTTDATARADMVIIATYPAPVEADCSLSLAGALQITLQRTGITGFPLPGRSPTLRVTPEVTTSEKLHCGSSRTTPGAPLSQIAITGTLRGEGAYIQGEASWPVSWNVKVGG